MALECINGKILHVDLTKRTTWVEEPPESFYRTYGGGSAMGLTYILKETPKGIDAFDPANVMTFFTGMPTGLLISGQSRISVNAKSPLTGAIGDSQSGGFFPARLKHAGFDGIVVRGKAASPVYLWINEGEVEIRDAAHLWGKQTHESEELIKQELKDTNVQILQIGPAGENKVRFAAIISMMNRANGRTGMGAVMGSKNLKAIVVQGALRKKAADPKALTELFLRGTKRIPDTPSSHGLHVDGTAGGVGWQNFTGGLPTRNYNEGQFEGHETIGGDVMTNTILVKRDTCFSCTIRCKRVVETEYKGTKVEGRFGGPEYETIGTFGSYCAISDLSAIALANQMCNQNGLDTITCGATIAWAMESFEKGQLTLEDTGGIDLHFGNADAMLKMVELIAKREGFGNILAEGSAKASKIIGRGTEDNLATAKGQEAPAHMPQVKRSMGLIYAVNPFGADHTQTEHDGSIEETAGEDARLRMSQIGMTNFIKPGVIDKERSKLVAVTQKVLSCVDTMGLCSFVWGVGWVLYFPAELVEMLRAVTGWDLSMEDVFEYGERRINLLRAFNMREGFTRKDDDLAPKFFRPLQGTGPSKGIHYTREEFEGMKDEYYRLMGWDIQTGNPTPEKLAELKLDWVAEVI